MLQSERVLQYNARCRLPHPSLLHLPHCPPPALQALLHLRMLRGKNGPSLRLGEQLHRSPELPPFSRLLRFHAVELDCSYSTSGAVGVPQTQRRPSFQVEGVFPVSSLLRYSPANHLHLCGDCVPVCAISSQLARFTCSADPVQPDNKRRYQPHTLSTVLPGERSLSQPLFTQKTKQKVHFKQTGADESVCVAGFISQ